MKNKIFMLGIASLLYSNAFANCDDKGSLAVARSCKASIISYISRLNLNSRAFNLTVSSDGEILSSEPSEAARYDLDLDSIKISLASRLINNEYVITCDFTYNMNVILPDESQIVETSVGRVPMDMNTCQFRIRLSDVSRVTNVD